MTNLVIESYDISLSQIAQHDLGLAKKIAETRGVNFYTAGNTTLSVNVRSLGISSLSDLDELANNNVKPENYIRLAGARQEFHQGVILELKKTYQPPNPARSRSAYQTVAYVP